MYYVCGYRITFITSTMTTFATRQNIGPKKASDYFLKMCSDLDIEKYKLEKYQDLFRLSSFQAMHDADLAYHAIYRKCSENAASKQTVLSCLEQEERFLTRHPTAFNQDIFRRHALNAISEIRDHLKNGDLDHLYF
jgi:hypothetical protein